MLNNKLVTLLTGKFHDEFFRSNSYLELAGWAADKSLSGFQAFFLAESKKSLAKAYQLLDYLNDHGHDVKIGEIPASLTQFKDITAVFSFVLEFEAAMKETLYNIADTATSEKEYTAKIFIDKQLKEFEAFSFTLNKLAQKLQLVGSTGHGLYLLDKELAGEHVTSEQVQA